MWSEINGITTDHLKRVFGKFRKLYRDNSVYVMTDKAINASRERRWFRGLRCKCHVVVMSWNNL